MNQLNPVDTSAKVIDNIDPNDFIDKLPAYDCNEGVISLLELAREICYSNAYTWMGVAFPFGNAVNIAANATLSGSVTVPESSYITSINYYDSDNAGFQFSLYDKGTKAPIIYGNYILDRILASNGSLQYGVDVTNPNISGMNLDLPFGQGYLQSPFIVSAPGVLNWEIVNQSASACLIQVMLCVAVPKTASNVRIIKRA